MNKVEICSNVQTAHDFSKVDAQKKEYNLRKFNLKRALKITVTGTERTSV